MPKHLVLFGEQRSGTSLLTSLLDAQPAIRMRTGLLFQALASLEAAGVYDATAPLEPALAARVKAELERASIRFGHPGLFAAPDRASGADLICAALDAGCRAERPTVVGSKEHAPTALTAGLLRDERLHVALIVRDARDVVHSRARRGDRALASKALMWRRSAQIGLRTGHPRFTLLRYERLAADPVRALRPLFRSLGVALDEEAVRRWELPEGRRTNTMFGTEMRRVSSRAVERWRGHTGEPSVRLAGWICRDELALLGYAEGPRLGLAERQRARAIEAVARARHRAGSAWRRARAARQLRA